MRPPILLLVASLAWSSSVRGAAAPPVLPTAESSETAAIGEWIHANAVPLPLDGDLTPFGRMVGDARIAVLGDASNGMHELFTVKSRLIQYLVAEKGFTSIAMAASFPDAMPVNEYVLHGTGDPSAALAGFAFWTWNSDEVLELIEWLRAWNADSAHPHKVSFHGLDMQNSAAVVERLRAVLGPGSSAALDALAPLEKRFGYANEPEWAKKKVLAAIHTLEGDVERRRKDVPDVELARQEVRLLFQAEEVFRRPLGEGDPREPRMAVNAQWLLDHDPGSKLVIWAFNGQAGVHPPSAPVSLGTALRHKYGRGVVIIGSAFGRGSLHAVPEGGGALTTFTTPRVRDGSLDALLSANAPPLSMLDLRTASGEARTWLTSLQTAHTIAEHYAVANDAAYYARLRPLETFDGVVFVRETTASHLRPPAGENLASTEAGRWIKEYAVPLKSVEAGNGFDDLGPVGEMVGNARIVALGEATHGTREFFQLKHRMLEYLVAKKGFTLFGIEASFPDALAVNEYVLHGTGDPGAALAGLQFWTWNTDEVLDLIRWMRAWNADPAHIAKVEFLGFDMQNPDASVRKLREYFTANGIDAAEALKARDVKMLTTLLDAHKADTREWELAREEVRLLEQGTVVMGEKANADSGARDRYMAENVKWILDHEPAGTKMVLWAHNGHVQNRDATELPSWTPMGSVLRKTYGGALVIFGFAFDRGEFQAMKVGGGSLQTMTVPPAPEGSLDALLAANAPPIAALDLRTASGAARQWLNEEQRTRSIGATFDPGHPQSYLVPEKPLVSYDALLFVAQTTAAHGRGVRASLPMPSPDAKALNLAFDEGKRGEPPPGWKNNSLPAGYRVLLTAEGCVSGTCVKVSRDGERTRDFAGVLMQRIDATPYRGKKIRFRARIRSDLPPGASARLWLRVDRPKGVMGMLDNMGDRLPGALPQWTELEARGEVAPDAEAIAFGLLFTGDGTAWMDEAVLEVVE